MSPHIRAMRTTEEARASDDASVGPSQGRTGTRETAGGSASLRIGKRRYEARMPFGGSRGQYIPLLECVPQGDRNMTDAHSRWARAKRGVAYAFSRLRRGAEGDKASSYWASLTDYHKTNDEDPLAIERSRWLADTVVPSIGAASLLEVGTNSGRNLQFIRESHPNMTLKGIDINPLPLNMRGARACRSPSMLPTPITGPSLLTSGTPS